MESQLLAPMGQTEARRCVDNIKSHLSEARELIYEFYTRGGWQALGYRTWTDCVEHEFPMSSRNVWRELAAAKTETNLLTDRSVGQIPEWQLRPLTGLPADAQREVWQRVQETAPRDVDGRLQLTGKQVQDAVNEWKAEREPPRQPISQFNATNENIEWAAWSWNPVTGCEHGCEYCYARDIANRFYPQGFEPTFHPDRLNAPRNTRMGEPRWTGDIGYRGVFVCSMADLFGAWVPQEWIDAVLSAVRKSPQWTFIFLTKNPQRLIGIDWPTNAWVGTTVDTQARVIGAQAAFRKIQASTRFLSCEPLREQLSFDSLDMFDWVIIGGQSRSSQAPEMQPKWEWVEDLHNQARAAGCSVYWKDNLKVRPREYPARGD